MHDLIFLHSGFMPRCTARVDKHFENYSTLQWMAEGCVELGYDERRYMLEGSWFWPAYPGPRICFHTAPGHAFWTHRYVAFRGALVEEWKAAGWWPEGPQPAPERSYAPRFDEMLAQSRRGGRWGTWRAANILQGILIELAEARAQPATREDDNQGWLDHVLEQLGAPDAFAPNYARLAAECNMGLSTLRRRFKEETGTTLHGYVLRHRIAAARELLGETDVPLKAVAERLGYNDVYFFSRQFQREAGVSPGVYRRSRQG